ncbi:glycoside hydrolase [Candidatus Reidiella endopervernicosa]|nr:glycoside hydrolase [Candidatus Reidiella endopervernicosa]
MHQPNYLDRESGNYQLPWTYLHAIKDYVDMAAIIEMTEGARAVVNFAPTLLEQIEDYAAQIKSYLKSGTPLRDPLLAALVSTALPSGEEERVTLIKACLRANPERLIDPYPHFKILADLAHCLDDTPHAVPYISGQYLTDLLVWYHLAWLGETVRRSDKRVKVLMDRERGYSHQERLQLLEIIGELIEGVIPRYRALAEAGKIELSVTPYAHPIIPLLLDINSTHDAMPAAHLPVCSSYPGGEQRVQWHLREGVEVFKRCFGHEPAGCWPSEGAVSSATLEQIAKAGFKWAATGENVLSNSLQKSGIEPGACHHHPFNVAESDIACFFRDDGLSDMIGFTYADWHGDDAVNNMVHHLENIAEACKENENRVVSIILDGENAWEYYPENGYHFLTALYAKLAEHESLELTTFSDVLASGVKSEPLPQMVAGSWVYGSFSTWIGEADKNRGWDLLCDAKKAFDEAVSSGRLAGDELYQAERQMAVCEGSDWFWWFGDYNPADSVRDFDRLFRLQLAELYRIVGATAPEQLTQVISHGTGQPATGGVMRRGSEH